MGSGRFDSLSYAASVADTARTAKRRGITVAAAAFGYSTDTKTRPQTAWKANDLLDPLQIKGVRESRDSDEHPTTVPTAVFFDVTGSMGQIPQVFQTKLPDLMKLLTEQGKIEHPHVLFGAIGDAGCDRVPFQVGQFESDNRCDDQLRNVFLEGGGGGNIMESYDLALYFAGYKTSIDSWEKRQKKGYLFTLGDEGFYTGLTRERVKKVFGDDVQIDLSFEDLLAKTQETFEYFHIHVIQGSYPNDQRILKPWRAMLGERLILLESSDLVCETIAGAVSLFQGSDSGLLKDMETTGTVAKALSSLKPPRQINAE